MEGSKKKSARALALQALGEFARTKAKPEEIIRGFMRKDILNPSDLRLLANLVFGVIRHRRLLDYLLDRHLKRPSRVPLKIRDILRTAGYQMLFCDRIPDRAAVHTSVELARTFSGGNMAGLVNAVLRKFQSSSVNLKKPLFPGDRTIEMAVRYSFPDWLVSRWVKNFGHAETEALLSAMNYHPPLNLRVNTLLISRDTAAEKLLDEGLSCSACRYSPYGLIAEPGRPIEQMTSFEEGLFSVQDEAFQLIGSLLPVEPGQIVLDAFAGLGGKSTLMAQLTRNQAIIVASDIIVRKLSALARECSRLRVENVFTAVANALFAPFKSNYFDAVILDVPCSGTGVIRRHPDIKWSRTHEDFLQLPRMQYKYLEHAARLIKRGGYLLYATCSIEPDENESVVMLFLKNYDKFRLVDLNQINVMPDLITSAGFFRSFPHKHGMDGSTAALMQKI